MAYRWFCGLLLNDKIPDHSTFSKTRTRKWNPSALFQKVFRSIINRCVEIYLIDSEEGTAAGSYLPAGVSRNIWIEVEEERPFQVGPVDKLTFSVFISACFLEMETVSSFV